MEGHVLRLGRTPQAESYRMARGDLTMYSTYIKTQPWIVINFLDEHVDANGGTDHVVFQCAICGDKTEKEVYLPGVDDPVWQTVDQENGLPEAHALRVAYQQE